jgi:outer membrane protein assembly factor BamB
MACVGLLLLIGFWGKLGEQGTAPNPERNDKTSQTQSKKSDKSQEYQPTSMKLPPQLKLKWKQKIDGYGGNLLVTKNIVGFSLENGGFCALDTGTGTEKWTLKSTGEFWSSPTELDNGLIVFRSTSRRYSKDAFIDMEYERSLTGIHAVDSLTGARKWQSKTRYGIQYIFAAPKGKVFLRTLANNLDNLTDESTMCLLDGNTGKTEWDSTSDWKFAPIGDIGTVFLAEKKKSSLELRVMAVDVLNKEVQWILPLQMQKGEIIWGAIGGVSANQGKLCFITNGISQNYSDNARKTSLYQIDAIKGQLLNLWTTQWPTPSSSMSNQIFLDADVAYIKTHLSNPTRTIITAINMVQNQELWQLKLLESTIITSLMVEDGTMYMTVGSAIYAVDARSGKIKWNSQLTNSWVARLGNRTVYAPNKDGYLYAITLQDIK